MATPKWDFDEFSERQANAHAALNKITLRLDTGMQISVISQGDNSAPGSPTKGDAYLTGTSTISPFEDNKLAYYDGADWQLLTIREGWRFYIQDINVSVTYDGTYYMIDHGELLRFNYSDFVLGSSPPGTASANIGGIVYQMRTFDKDAIEKMFAIFPNLNDKVTGRLHGTIYWKPTTSGSGVVRWKIGINTIADDASLSVTLNYTTAEDTFLATDDLHKVDFGPLLFGPGGINDLTVLEIQREATHANDTLDVDAGLMMVVCKISIQ